MREHAELLSSVRDDISEYKVSISVILVLFSGSSEFIYFSSLKLLSSLKGSESSICISLSGIWECIPKNAVTEGEGCNSWQHSPCKINRSVGILLILEGRKGLFICRP